ncbi:MAG: hypothetical protein FWG45_02960 [Oscillospiraceae bacterium]|nr:hypothetical protein [Oscillospiraceae bacterium]
MLKGNQIIRIGVGILGLSLILAHTANIPHEISAFFMGLGCSLSFVGTGKSISLKEG